MLHVGLIGLGGEWNDRYRPAFERLRQRIAIRCLYAPVQAHAEQLALELKCEPAAGLYSMIERNDVQAVVVLNPEWHAAVPIRMACELGKPIFVAEQIVHSLSSADWMLRAADSGLTVMPGLSHRYSPATSRLRELIATQLGRPRQIEMEVHVAPPLSGEVGVASMAHEISLAEALDWCVMLTGMQPHSFREAAPASAAAIAAVEVDFRPYSGSGGATRAVVKTQQSSAECKGTSGSMLTRISVDCEHGSATLSPPLGLDWESAGERLNEDLSADRTDVDVMLDHFTRRALGGLIPVPTFEDVFRVRDFVAVIVRKMLDTAT